VVAVFSDNDSSDFKRVAAGIPIRKQVANNLSISYFSSSSVAAFPLELNSNWSCSR